MPKLTKVQREALKILDLFYTKEKKYYDLNWKIKELQPDFPTHIQSIDSEYFEAIVGLLDLFLEDMAGYFLWERPDSGGFIGLKDGREFPINSIDDLKKYLERDDEKMSSL